METQDPSSNPTTLSARAKQLLALITPVIPSDDDSGRDYRYRFQDPETSRIFEIRRSQGLVNGQERPRYFMSEMEPIGRVVERIEADYPTFRDEPRILLLEKEVGPNALMAALRAEGIDSKNLVLMGGGYGVGSIFHPSLEACASAITQALADDVRYAYFEPESEQDRTRRAMEEARDSHAYWNAQEVRQASANQEHGVFKGLSSILGPLNDDSKLRILGYLNKPTQKSWLDVRGLVVTGHGTLWQAWCHHDPAAPRSGDQGFPSRTQLLEALESARNQRAQEIETRLAATSATGLRRVK